MSEGVVVTQPGQKGGMMGMQPVGMQPGGAPPSAIYTQPTPMPTAGFVPMTMPQVVIPSGLPPGLAYLAGLEEIRIHQQMDLLEVFAGWERNNRYTLCNNQEQQFMYAKEKTDCMTRQCCGPARPFTMDITDNQGIQLVQLHRPLRCHACCMWCCCLQEMEIHSPAGTPVGRVEQLWTCCNPKYKVYDSNQQCVFTIVGECCYCKCSDVIFRLFEGDSDAQEVGEIRKHFGGAREICGQANDFTLFVPAQMDIMRKVLLLGATFLIDFNYFEHSKN